MTQQIKKPPYLMIGIMMMGTFVAVLNNVLLNNALPMIMRDLQIEQYSTVQWLTTAYMLVAGVLIPTSAFFITKFNSRHVFIVTMSIFTVGTILAGFAQTFPILLTARVIQAVGGAVLSPLLMNVMLVSFDKDQRGKAMGIYGLIIMFAPSIGPTLSGFIVDNLGWRWLFMVIAPIAIISLVLSFWKLENVLKQHDTSIDGLSVVLSTAGFSSILYGFNNASSLGWSHVSFYGFILLGLVALVLFVIRQFKIETPLLDLRVYKYPMFALSSLLSTILAMLMYALMILLPYYLQTVQGYTTLKSGMIMLPASLLMALCMPFAGRLYDRFGALPLALVGFPLIGIATILLSRLQIDTSETYVIASLMIRNLGIAMIMMPVQTNGLMQLPSRLNPSGTAVNATIQQISGAIGTAIFATMMTNFAATRATTLAQEVGGQLTDAVQADISRQALLSAINQTAQITIGFVIVGFIFSFFIRKRIHHEESLEKTA